MDRRTSIKWVLAASAAWPVLATRSTRADSSLPVRGYGTDPKLVADYRPGELWPLTLSASQRRLTSTLADLILPADEHSPSASAVGVVDFIDEWVSAPYEDHQRDQTIIVDGLGWMIGESIRQSGKVFSDLDTTQQHALCDAICDEARARSELHSAARFFALFRDLASAGFYSSPVGRKDLNFIGNVPLARFDGPPAALLKTLGLQ